jgi:uncharacterized protein (DUF2062 family)
MKKWIAGRIPQRDGLLRSRWIRPFAHRLVDPSLWHLNRRSTARGLALGLFVGLIVPIGQTPIAALLALSARANIIVAAVATLITNPLTFPAIYFAAYKVGQFLLGADKASWASHDQVVHSWSHDIGSWLVSTTIPLALGLFIFASVAAVFGYCAVHLGWRIWVVRDWRNRKRQRSLR